jgi:hypothetical protein
VKPEFFTKLRIQWATDSGMTSHHWEVYVPAPYGWLIIASLAITIVTEAVKNRGKP